jgi:hypothetical protein
VESGDCRRDSRGTDREERGVKMENSDWRMENVRMEIYSLLWHHSETHSSHLSGWFAVERARHPHSDLTASHTL